MKEKHYINRELSWLEFNCRVQTASIQKRPALSRFGDWLDGEFSSILASPHAT
jgi:polyphosphate kinase